MIKKTYDKNKNTIFSGFILCVIIGGLSIIISKYISIGAVSVSIILGIILKNTKKTNTIFQKGIMFSEKNVLSFAIALTGVNLDYSVLQKLGYKTVATVVSAIIITLLLSLLLSKMFNFSKTFALMLGIGNGVCGSSAIAATKNIVGAKEEEVGLAIAIVNFLGTIGIFLLPVLAYLTHLNNLNAGILIGNTLQAVGQVVAAGFSVSDSSGQIATIVKMTRILMLTPLIVGLIFLYSEKPSLNKQNTKKQKIPLFIIGFFIFSLLPAINIVPIKVIKLIAKLGRYALIVAMAGIGLQITFQSIVKNGKKAFVIASVLFIFQIMFNLTVITLLFN
jgi:uncharacterized integral membrane protein (TIGR00698 family)